MSASEGIDPISAAEANLAEFAQRVRDGEVTVSVPMRLQLSTTQVLLGVAERLDVIVLLLAKMVEQDRD